MEEFRKIEGYPDYEVSNEGRVISWKNGKRKVRKSWVNAYGHLQISLFKDGKRKMFYVHRLVAKAFIQNLEDKPQVNHKDGNKKNNYATNLEWATHAEDIVHAYKIGLIKSGEDHHRARLTEKNVKEIRHRYKCRGEDNLYSFAREFGVYKSTVWQIVNFKTWKNVK